MNISRVRTVEQHKKPAAFITPVPVELDKQPMCLGAGNKIVMEADPLTWNEFVRCNIESVIQGYFKQLFKLCF